MSFFIAQAIGLVITGMTLVVQHFKKMHHILAMEFLMNGMAAVQYFLLDGMSGAWVSLIASVKILCVLICTKISSRNSKFVSNLLYGVFTAINVTVGILNIHAWYDVFPVLGCLVGAAAMLQSKAGNYRVLRITNAVVWIVYCVCAQAYSMILMQILCIVSGVSAILRLDVKKKEKDTI